MLLSTRLSHLTCHRPANLLSTSFLTVMGDNWVLDGTSISFVSSKQCFSVHIVIYMFWITSCSGTNLPKLHRRCSKHCWKVKFWRVLMTWRDISAQFLTRTSLSYALSASPSSEDRHAELLMMHILHPTMFVTFAAVVSSLPLVFPTAPSMHTLSTVCLPTLCWALSVTLTSDRHIQTSTSVYFYSQMMFYSTHSCSGFPFCTSQNKSHTYQLF